jgi:NAD(P)H-nitrite reductase large subunit
MKKYDFVIIGNSAGGIGCVETLRTLDKDASIAVISDEKYHTYSRALIPYYLDGKIEFDKMYYRPLDFYERMRVDALLGIRITEIDFDKKILKSDDGVVGYGKLLLATGGKPFVPPIEGIDKKKVFTFVKMDDVIGIKDALQSAEKAVVLGGGVIGLMVAEVLKKRGLEVTVVELADRVLAPVVDRTTSMFVEDAFRENGVKIITGNTIKKVLGKENVESVVLEDGTEIPADLLVVGIGVMPRIELVKDTAIETNRGIVVNSRMETTVKDVYACGDCAEVYDFLFDAKRPLPLWPIAYAGGRIAAFNMCGIDREYTNAIAMNAMHFFDLYIINAGLNVADDEEGYEILKKFDEENRIYRKIVLREGKIAGMILVGEVERAGVIINLMRREVDVISFKERLLDGDFGYADLPESIRWRLLYNDVILGVVREP